MPERTDRLLKAVRQMCEVQGIRNVDIARSLGISPQAVWNIFNGKSQVSGEQALALLDELLLKDQSMKPHLIDPPKMPRETVRDPNEPRTLHEAKEMLAALRKSKPVAIASPAAPKLTANQAPPTNPSALPGFQRVQSPPPPPPKQLPASANTPYLIGEILKVTNFEDCLSLLANPSHTQLQQSLLYSEVKARRALVANRQ